MSKEKATRGPGRPPKYPKGEGQDRSMKRFQLSLRPEIFAALEKFRAAQEFETERSAMIEKMIEAYLTEKGCAPGQNGASNGK